RYEWFSRERIAYLERYPDTWKTLARLLPPRLLSAADGAVAVCSAPRNRI
ncbi:MAG: hypothetical protein JNK68_16120, partial [Betaproteobacteria bacterium]|nr:hypothetical protein [Betaproteobacteria bacterium]